MVFWIKLKAFLSNTSNAAAEDTIDWVVRMLSSRVSSLIAIWCGEVIHIYKYRKSNNKIHLNENKFQRSSKCFP